MYNLFISEYIYIYIYVDVIECIYGHKSCTCNSSGLLGYMATMYRPICTKIVSNNL